MIKLKFLPQEAIAEAVNNLTKAFLVANGSDEQTATMFGATLSGAIKGIGIVGYWGQTPLIIRSE